MRKCHIPRSNSFSRVITMFCTMIMSVQKDCFSIKARVIYNIVPPTIASYWKSFHVFIQIESYMHKVNTLKLSP